MKDLDKELKIYGITDSSWGHNFFDILESLLGDGVTMIQLREKELTEEQYIEKAEKTIKLCHRYKVPVIINDNVEVAYRSGADGVHLGQGDGFPQEARKILGPDAIIGVTAKTPDQARKAEAEGADYLGSGALFVTETKKDAKPLTFEEFSHVCNSVDIPVVAIGGITADNIMLLRHLPMKGFAISAGLLDQEKRSRVRALKHKIDKIF